MRLHSSSFHQVIMSQNNAICFGCDPVLSKLWTQHFSIVKRHLTMNMIQEAFDRIHNGTHTQDRTQCMFICVLF